MKKDRKEKGNVPNLRFPQFTGDWEKKKINTLTNIKAGATPSTLNAEYWNGNIRWMSSGELNKKRIYEVNGRISELGLQKTSTTLVPSGCVLIGLAGQGKTRGTAAINYVELCTNQSIASILPSKNVNSEFLYQNIESRYQELRDISSGDGGRGGLNLSIIGNLYVPICSMAEQQKIAQFLHLIDQRIETQNKIIEDLKKLKTALVDILYNFHNGKSLLRFPEFSDCWQQYTYGDLFHVSTARNADQSINLILSASQTRGMIERDKIDIDIKFEQASTRTYKIVKSGNYIIHLRSFQGGFAFSEKEGICSPAYTVLKPTHLLKHTFMKDYFISSRFIKTLKLVTYGIRDGRSINVEEFLKLPIAIPSLKEQSKINEALIVLEEKILNEYKLYISLIKQKQGLLKSMFI